MKKLTKDYFPKYKNSLYNSISERKKKKKITKWAEDLNWYFSIADIQMTNKYMKKMLNIIHYSVQLSSIPQSCPTLCDPMDCSTPGFPVRHQLPELAQTHVHRVSDAIQTSHPLLSPSPPAFSLSQHQGVSQ